MMDRLGIAFPEKGKWGVETEFLEALKQAMHPDASEWRGAWSSASDKGFLGEETAEESIESVIAASDRILADRKDEYDEMKAWGRTL